MSDFALKASVDFSGAEKEVDAFVSTTKKKLSDIMAAASKAGGSLGGKPGAGGNSTPTGNSRVPTGSWNRPSRPATQFQPNLGSMDSTADKARQSFENNAEKMRRSFEGNISFMGKLRKKDADDARAVEKQVTAWTREEQATRTQQVKRAMEARNAAAKEDQVAERRRISGQASWWRQALDEQARAEKKAREDNKAAEQGYSRFLREEETKRTKAAKADTATRTAATAQQRLETQRRGSSISQAFRQDLSTRQGNVAVGDAELRADRLRSRVQTAFANAPADQTAQLNRLDGALKTYASTVSTYGKNSIEASEASLKFRRELQGVGEALTKQNASARASTPSATTGSSEASRLRATGSISNAQATTAYQIRSKLNDSPNYQGKLLNELDSAATQATTAINKYGASSAEAAAASVAWGGQLTKIRQRLAEEVTALKEAEKARNSATTATQRETKAAETAAAAQSRSANAAAKAAQRENVATIRAQGRASNSTLGITNRIDRQLGADPALQQRLNIAAAKALDDYNKVILRHGVASKEAAVATNVFNRAQQQIRGSIAEHGGLLKTLNSNTNTLSGSLKGLGGSYGGLSRMMMNTQVALTALTAAFGTREILNTATQLESVQNTLRAVSPDAETASANFEFLRRVGDTLGVSYLDVGRSFAQLTAAMTTAGATTEQSQQVFLRLTGASKNLGLSTADTEGVIRAMTQSFSKGRFAAEELRQQLGDRLPIAMAAMEKATGKSGEALDKLMREGKITTAQYSAAFVNALFEMSGGMEAVNRSSQSLGSATARLSNAFSDLVLKNPQILKGLTSLLDGIRALLVSDTVSQGLRVMATMFGFLGDAIKSASAVADEYLAPVFAKINEDLKNGFGTSISVIAGALSGAFVMGVGAATAATVAFTVALATNPIGLIAVGVGLAVAAYMQFKDVMVDVQGKSLAVRDVLSGTFEVVLGWIEKTVTALQEVSDRTDKFFDPIVEEMGTAFGQIMDVVKKVTGFFVQAWAMTIDAVATVIKVLPKLVEAVGSDIVNAFNGIKNTIVNGWGALMTTFGAAAQAMAEGAKAMFASIWSGNIAGAADAAMAAMGDVMKKGLASAAAQVAGDNTFPSAVGKVLEETMAEGGVTAAQDFVRTFGATLSGLGPVISGSISGVMNGVADDIAKASAQAAAIRIAAASHGGEGDGPGNPYGGRTDVRIGANQFSPGGGLLRPLEGTTGRTVPSAGKADKGAQSAANAVKELMQDLRRQSASAGADGGADTEITRVMNKIKDAAETAKASLETEKQQAEALILVYQKLDKEMDLYIRQTDRTTRGNNQIAAGYSQSYEAGQRAEIVVKAQTEALKYARPEFDANGNAIGRYREEIEKLIPVLTRSAEGEKNAAASRSVASNRDQIALLEKEGQLLSTNVNLREQELAAFKARQDNRGASEDKIKEAENSARALVRAQQNTDQLKNSMDELANIGEQAFDRIGSSITEAFANGKMEALSFKNISKAIFSEIIQAGLKMAVLNPMLNSLFGGTRATLGGAITAMSGGSIGVSNSSGTAAASVLSSLSNNSSTSGASPAAGSSKFSFGDIGTWGSGIKSLFGSGSGGIFDTSSITSGWSSGMQGAVMANNGMGLMPAGEAASQMSSLSQAATPSLNLSGAAIGQSAGGVAAGMAIGSMVGGFVAGAKNPAKQQNAQIGSAIGSVVGMYFGPIGSMVGGALGGAIGGLFGPKGQFKGGVGRIGVDANGQFVNAGTAGKNYDSAEVDKDITQQVTALNRVLRERDITLQASTKKINTTSFNPLTGALVESQTGGSDLVAEQGYGEAKQMAEPDLVRAFKERGTTNNKVRDSVMKASKAETLDELFADLDWSENVYEPLMKTGTAASQFNTSLDAALKPIDEAIKKAKDLGLAEDVLRTKRAEAEKAAYDERDRTLRSTSLDLDARRMQAQGTYAGADVMYRWEADAKEQIRTLTESLKNLGLTAEEASPYLKKLDTTLAAERVTAQRAAARADQDAATNKWAATAAIDFDTLSSQGKNNTSATLSFNADAENKLRDLRRALEDLGFGAEEITKRVAQATANLDVAKKRMAEDQSIALADLNGGLVDRYQTAMGTADDLTNQLIRLERQHSAERIQLARQEGADLNQLAVTQAAERNALVKADAEKTKNSFMDIGKTVRAFLDNLKSTTSASRSPTDAFNYASLMYERDIKLAGTGDADASERITNTAQTLLEAASEMYASGEQFTAVRDYVESTLARLPATVSYDAETVRLLKEANAADTAAAYQLNIIATRAGGEAGAGIVKAAVDSGYGATLAALNANFTSGQAFETAVVSMTMAADAANAGSIISALTTNLGGFLAGNINAVNSMSNSLWYAVTDLRGVEFDSNGKLNWIGGIMAAVSGEQTRTADAVNATQGLFHMLNGTLVNGTNAWLSLIRDGVANVATAIAAKEFGGNSGSIAPMYNGNLGEVSSGGDGAGDGGGAYAKGGAFINGVEAFARGGSFSNSIISHPTNFDMGLMGEAGPEAIMPLTRTSDGSLGVQALVTTSGGSDDGVVVELRAMRAELAQLRAERKADAKRAEQQRDQQTGAAQDTASGVESLRLNEKSKQMRKNAA